MCRAAASGAVDFTRFDPSSPRDWRRLALLLDQVEQEALDALRRLAHAHASRCYAALLATPGAPQKALDAAHDRVEQALLRAQQGLFPWVEFDARAETRKAMDAMHAQWVAVWGDPNDPEVAARIDATVAAMDAATAAATPDAAWR